MAHLSHDYVAPADAGIAASFLLMFVEALADLGNPIFIGGNITCSRPKSGSRSMASSTNKKARRCR